MTQSNNGNSKVRRDFCENRAGERGREREREREREEKGELKRDLREYSTYVFEYTCMFAYVYLCIHTH
jgi:hypothetical protein